MPKPRFTKLGEAGQIRILTEAANEFAEFGFNGASLSRIIERGGYSKGAAFYFFDHKEDLYETLFSALVTAAEAHFDGRAMMKVTSRTFWSTLHEMAIGFFDAIQGHEFLPLTVQIFLRLPRRSEPAPAQDMYGRLADVLADYIDMGRRLRVVRDDMPVDLQANLAASTLDAVYHWAVEHMRGSSYDASKMVVDKALKVLERSLRRKA